MSAWLDKNKSKTKLEGKKVLELGFVISASYPLTDLATF
jgi:hypothetical protein